MRTAALPAKLRLLVSALLVAVVSPSAMAQARELEGIAREIAAKLAGEKARSLVVGELLGPESRRTELGEALAGELAAALLRTAPGVRIIPREPWSAVIVENELRPEQAIEEDVIDWVGELAGVEAVIVGQVSADTDRYDIRLVLRYVGRPGRRDDFQVKLARTIERDAQSMREAPQPPPPPDPPSLLRASNLPDGSRRGRYRIPDCIHCPDPGFTREARASNYRGRVLLQVVVMPDGRAGRIRVIESAPYGLTRLAVRAVRRWQFKPGSGPDRQPVPFEINIELVFRRPP
jgi:TonB family protein